jgi:transketolase
MASMREAFVRETTALLDENKEACVVLADIGNAQFRESGAIERHPDRVINVGIREQLMVGVAAGMALEGFRPIVHTYAPFLVERPYEQIKLDLAHQGVGAVLVSIGASYDAAGGGRTHQAPEDVALMYTVPRCAVFVPGHPDEVGPILRNAVEGAGEGAGEGEGIAYIRLGDEENREPILEGAEGIAKVKHGSVATVLAVGPALQPVLDGCSDLDLTVLYTASPRPLDERTLLSAVGGTDVIVVEPYLEGTSTADITRILSDQPRRFISVGVPVGEHRRYGTGPEHRAAHGLDANGVRSRILRGIGESALKR